MEVEFVKNALAFVNFTKFLIKVFCHIECLNRLCIVPHVPDVHRQVVSGEEIVVARGSKFGHPNGVDYLCEEMLPRWVFLQFDLGCVVAELR